MEELTAAAAIRKECMSLRTQFAAENARLEALASSSAAEVIRQREEIAQLREESSLKAQESSAEVIRQRDEIAQLREESQLKDQESSAEIMGQRKEIAKLHEESRLKAQESSAEVTRQRDEIAQLHEESQLKAHESSAEVTRLRNEIAQLREESRLIASESSAEIMRQRDHIEQLHEQIRLKNHESSAEIMLQRDEIAQLHEELARLKTSNYIEAEATSSTALALEEALHTQKDLELELLEERQRSSTLAVEKAAAEETHSLEVARLEGMLQKVKAENHHLKSLPETKPTVTEAKDSQDSLSLTQGLQALGLPPQPAPLSVAKDVKAASKPEVPKPVELVGFKNFQTFMQDEIERVFAEANEVINPVLDEPEMEPRRASFEPQVS